MGWFKAKEPSPPTRLYLDFLDVEGHGTLLYVDYGGVVETWFLRASQGSETHPVRASDGLMLTGEDSERLRGMLRAQRAVAAAASPVPVLGKAKPVALLGARPIGFGRT